VQRRQFGAVHRLFALCYVTGRWYSCWCGGRRRRWRSRHW